MKKAKYKQCYEEWWDDGCCEGWIDKEWIDEVKKMRELHAYENKSFF